MEGSSRRARERWKILAKVITKKSSPDSQIQNKVSVRRFGGFELFRVQDSAEYDDNSSTYYQIYTHAVDGFHSQDIFIRKKRHHINLQDLVGFNNTGSVCVWPSEEVLAYYLLKHKSEFQGKRICELGAGMSALAGIMLAASSSVDEVLLTDGNQESVSNIEAIIQKNKQCFGTTKVHSRVLLWNDRADTQDLTAKYDVIIAADCFFFVDCHKGLLHMLDKMLTQKGRAIMMAPSRAQTLQQFCAAAEGQFVVQVIVDYDLYITEQHNKALTLGSEEYEEDIHYPVLVLLTRPDTVYNDNT